MAERSRSAAPSVKGQLLLFAFPASVEDRRFDIADAVDVTLDARPDGAISIKSQPFLIESLTRPQPCQDGCNGHILLGLTEMSAIVMILPACAGLCMDNMRLIWSSILLFSKGEQA